MLHGMDCVEVIVCPLCGEGVVLESDSLVCPARHTFDVARSGYVNLLPSTRKLPETVGDSAEMLAARARFLDGGHFAPLTEHLGGITPGPGYLVEVGSGTGHYLAALGDGGACRFGIDISKAAARMAAARHRDITFLVADVHKGIPLASRRGPDCFSTSSRLATRRSSPACSIRRGPRSWSSRPPTIWPSLSRHSIS